MELDVQYFHKMKIFFTVNQVVYARGRSSVEKCLAGRLCFCQSFVSSAVLSHKKMSTVEGGANRTSSSVSQGHLSGKSFQDYPRICPIHLCRYSFFLYCDTGRLTRSDRNTALPGIHSVYGTPLTRDVLCAWRNYPCPRSQYWHRSHGHLPSLTELLCPCGSQTRTWQHRGRRRSRLRNTCLR